MSLLIKITPSKTFEILALDPTAQGFEQYYREIGTDIVEPAPHDLGEHLTVWVDEEGLLKPNPRGNVYASILTGRTIYGTAIVVGASPNGSQDVGLTPQQTQDIYQELCLRSAAAIAEYLGEPLPA